MRAIVLIVTLVDSPSKIWTMGLSSGVGNTLAKAAKPRAKAMRA